MTEKQEQDLASVLQKQLDDLERERREDDQRLRDLLVDGRAQIETEEDAGVVVKVMAALDAEKRRVKRQADARVARIAERERSIEFLFHTALAQWTFENLKGKKKSIILPDGTLKTRTVPEKVVTESEDTLRDWASVERPQALNLKRTPIIMAEITEWEKVNGKLAPGRVKQEEYQDFRVTFPKEKHDDEHAD